MPAEPGNEPRPPQSESKSEKSAQRSDSDNKKPFKGESRLKKLGDVVVGVSNSPVVAVLGSNTSKEAFGLLRDHVSSFARNSRALMDVMDELAKVHPFIQVAVSLFKAGLTLELTRRENDDKVIALNVTMCDMMETLKLLDNLNDLRDEAAKKVPAIKKSVEARMSAIEATIKECAWLCDSYQKRHIAVKFFTSVKWKSKFTEVAQKFAVHKVGIQFDLQLDASLGIAQANVMLASVDVGVTYLNDRMEELIGNVANLMDMVFDRMRSPMERDIATLISKQEDGMEAVLNNNKLLARLLENANAETGKKGYWQGLGGAATMTVEVLREEVGKEVDQVLRENEAFEKKFTAVKEQIDSVKSALDNMQDRVTKTILGSPWNERIADENMRLVWREMGWKGSAKAKHLVMALRDHFADASHAALEEIRTITDDQQKPSHEPAEKAVEKISEVARRVGPQDVWALQYITVSRVQPLIEALDDDISSFVTISELNSFTRACPPEWSLPHWMAYWTIGFEMSVQWYFRRIRKLLAMITHAAKAARPENRALVANFVASWELRVLEDLLSGLKHVDDWDGRDWDNDAIFGRFRDYVLKEEMKLDRGLQSIKYYIDETNTLVIIAGGGRPEKYMMPIFFLLIRRSLFIVEKAQTEVLADQELDIIGQSLVTVYDVIWARVSSLQAMYRLLNLSERDKLSEHFFGLFSHAKEEPEVGPYWMRNSKQDADVDVNIVTLTPGEDPKSPSNDAVGETKTENPDEYPSIPLVSLRDPKDPSLTEVVRVRPRDVELSMLFCDSCASNLLPSSRYLCVECFAGEVNHTIDFCGPCFARDPTESKAVSEVESDTTHTRRHSFCQLRSVILRTYLQASVTAALSIVEWVDAHLSPLDEGIDPASSVPIPVVEGVMMDVKSFTQEGGKCAECSMTITARPFWCCMDCYSITLVCWSCNERIERERRWLEPQTDPSDKIVSALRHDWSHTLVSAPAHPLDESNSESKNGTEERLASLEAKLELIHAFLSQLCKVLSTTLAVLILAFIFTLVYLYTYAEFGPRH